MAEPDRAPPLTMLQAGRGIAALLVVLFHLGGVFAAPRAWHVAVDGGLFRFGHEGVAFFFVLSGFIILHAHLGDLGRPARLPDYLRKRAMRIYLPYWLVVLPLIAAYLAFPALGGPSVTAPAVMRNSPLLVGADNHATLAVAWTLFHEVAFYALFALAIVNARLGVIVLLLWQAACVAALVTQAPVHYAVQPINLLFGLGMAARLLLGRAPLPVMLMWAGLVAAVLLGLALDYTHWIAPRWSSLSFGAASVAFVIGAAQAEQRGRIASPRVLKRLGDASYALYLGHFPIISGLMKFAMLRMLPAPIAYALILAACLSGGFAFHLMVERPLLRRLGGSARTRRKIAS